MRTCSAGGHLHPPEGTYPGVGLASLRCLESYAPNYPPSSRLHEGAVRTSIASPRHRLLGKFDGHSSDRVHEWKETGSRGAVPRVMAGLGEGPENRDHLKSESQGKTRKWRRPQPKSQVREV